MKLPPLFSSAVLLGAVSVSLASTPCALAQKVSKTKPFMQGTTPAKPVTNDTGTSTAVATDPVGFITLSVAGTHSVSSSALSFLGQGMTRPVEYASSATGTSASTLTDSKAGWTDDQFNVVTSSGATTGSAYYVELTSGNGVGLWADIVSTNGASTTHAGTANTLTLSVDLSPYITTGTTYKIRKNWTLSAFFGADPTAANASGLNGGTSTTADQVLLYTPAVYNSAGTLVTPSSYTTFYYQNAGFGGTGWRSNASNSADASGTKFEPTSGILVQRYQPADLSFALVGAVKTGTTDLPVAYGLNFVSNPYPVSSVTLATSGLYNPTDPAGNTLVGGNATTADQVLIYQPPTYSSGNQLTPGIYNTYYYQTTGFGGTGWRSTASNNADASGTVIPIGQSILIQRYNKTVAGDGSFGWITAQPF